MKLRDASARRIKLPKRSICAFRPDAGVRRKLRLACGADEDGETLRGNHNGNAQSNYAERRLRHGDQAAFCSFGPSSRWNRRDKRDGDKDLDGQAALGFSISNIVRVCGEELHRLIAEGENEIQSVTLGQKAKPKAVAASK